MRARICVGLILCLVAVCLRADWVIMQNGDRYSGKVLSVTTTNLALQSDVLGMVTLSRANVAHVVFGTNVVANHPPLFLSSPSTNRITLPATNQEADKLSAALRQLGAYTNLIRSVQSQFLAAAGPDANEKFGQMLSDLTTGKMNIADLRAQAKDVANQLRSLQRESGEDTGFATDLYLSILDRFLQETESSKSTTTNPPAAPPKP
jgi:hypothetical protein